MKEQTKTDIVTLIAALGVIAFPLYGAYSIIVELGIGEEVFAVVYLAAIFLFAHLVYGREARK